MISEAKKILPYIILLVIVVIVIFLGKNFSGNFRNLFLSANFNSKIVLLRQTSYRADIVENGKTTVWIQKPSFWRLEDSETGKIVIYKGEDNKVYIVNPIYKNVSEDTTGKDTYVQKSPDNIANAYASVAWKTNSGNSWTGTLKDGSKITINFESIKGLLSKILILDDKNNEVRNMSFNYSNIDNVDANLFDPFAIVSNNAAATPVPNNLQTIPKTGPKENVLALFFIFLPLGLFFTKIAKKS